MKNPTDFFLKKHKTIRLMKLRIFLVKCMTLTKDNNLMHVSFIFKLWVIDNLLQKK